MKRGAHATHGDDLDLHLFSVFNENTSLTESGRYANQDAPRRILAERLVEGIR